MNPDHTLVKAQAKLIDKLHADIRRIQVDYQAEYRKLHEECSRLRQKAYYYELIEHSVKDNPTLRQDFIDFMMLVQVGLTEKVPGINC